MDLWGAFQRAATQERFDSFALYRSSFHAQQGLLSGGRSTRTTGLCSSTLHKSVGKMYELSAMALPNKVDECGGSARDALAR